MVDETSQSAPDDGSPGIGIPEWPSNGHAAESDAVASAEARSEIAAESGVAIEEAPSTAEPAVDDGTAFLASLTTAMKSAAAADRTRVTEDVDRRRDAHLAGIETRREAEAGKIRELADEDRKGIEAWVAGEQERVQAERERREAALQTDLETSLSEHGAKVDAEKERVDAAIVGYRSEVDAYFAQLEGETDPVAIAQHAGKRPVFPNLDAIGRGDDAPAAAGEPLPSAGKPQPIAGQAPLIGVMASTRPTTKLSQAWAAWSASTKVADEAAPTGAAATEAEPAPATTPAGAYLPPADLIDQAPEPTAEPSAEPVPVPVAAGITESPDETPASPDASEPSAQQPSSGFGAMSWLRRNNDNGGK